jgi:hypothetical protein
MPLMADSVVDLVRGTLKNLGRHKWTQAATTIQNFHGLPRLLKKEARTYGSGYGMQWNVMTTTVGNARRSGLYDTDNLNYGDVMQQAYSPWRYVVTGGVIDKRQMTMNSGEAEIFSNIKAQDDASIIDSAVIVETDLWSKPADSTDTSKAFGIPYWVVKSATAGFTGTNPSGFTAGAGGISSTTYPTWANYAAPYTPSTLEGAASGLSLYQQTRLAFRKTNFQSPISDNGYGTGTARFALYCNSDTMEQCENQCRNNNDNLAQSGDLAFFMNKAAFKRIPLEYVASLDSDTTDPLYGIDWDQFGIGVLAGWNLKRSDPTDSGQHNVVKWFTDLVYNYQCFNRRANFVISNGT